MSGQFDRGNWFKREFASLLEKQHFMPGESLMCRSESLYFDKFGVSEYLRKERLKGRRVGVVCDYGSGNGYDFYIAEALEAERLIMMDYSPTNKIPPMIERLVDNSDRIDFIPVETPSTFPHTDLKFDLMMINDVLGFVADDKVVTLLQEMERSLTDNGIGVVTVTDNEHGQRDRLMRHFDIIVRDAPDLLKRFVFITYKSKWTVGVEDREEVMLGENVSDTLAYQIKQYNLKSQNDVFIMHSIN